jgi:hypothetical protein
MKPTTAALISTGAIAMLALLSKTTDSGAARGKFTSRQKSLTALMKGSARYAALSAQDQNTAMKFLHATYGKAFVEAARHCADDSTILEVTHIHPGEAYTLNEEQQQTALAALNRSLPPEETLKSDAALATGWVM